MKELQEELVGKIALIPTENDRASVKRALEIVNEVKDHINDTIVFGDQWFTALDYVIIADSQGSNPKISERPRIGNRALKELEDAIRNIGGRTSEELGLVQNVSYSRSEFLSASEQRALQILEEAKRDSNRRMVREITRNLAHYALFASSSYLVYTPGIRNDNDEEFSMSRYLTGLVGVGVYVILKAVDCRNLFRALTRGEQERQVPTNLENTIDVRSNIGERQPILG